MKKMMLAGLILWMITSCFENKKGTVNDDLNAPDSVIREESGGDKSDIEMTQKQNSSIEEDQENTDPVETSPPKQPQATVNIDEQIQAIMEKTYSRDTESQKIIDGYRSITWWDLISDEEYLYYRRTNEAYDLDYDYIPETEPPAEEVNRDIDGIKVRIPGYIVGVDTEPDDFTKVNSFLFVPYQGACIHVPPPPPNQTVFAEVDEAVQTNPYMGYWLYGTIHIESGNNDMASFFYTFKADKLEDYK